MSKPFSPGTLGVGCAVWLPPAELAGHIDQVRAENFPDFTVRPAGLREQYSSIIYLEPFNERNRQAFGYDMYSNPVRRAAMERARDTGKTAISGMVTLAQEITDDIQHGFLIYVPTTHKPFTRWRSAESSWRALSTARCASVT